MALRGRKKRVEQQKNTLLSYMKPPPNEPEIVCKVVVDELVNKACCTPKEVVSDILDDLLLHVCKPPKKHDGEKVGKSTVKGWLSKYPWLEINDNDSYTNMRCSVCVEIKSKLKVSSVWANEGTPNIQSSSITRHNLTRVVNITMHVLSLKNVQYRQT